MIEAGGGSSTKEKLDFESAVHEGRDIQSEEVHTVLTGEDSNALLSEEDSIEHYATTVLTGVHSQVSEQDSKEYSEITVLTGVHSSALHFEEGEDSNTEEDSN